MTVAGRNIEWPAASWLARRGQRARRGVSNIDAVDTLGFIIRWPFQNGIDNSEVTKMNLLTRTAGETTKCVPII